MKKILILVLFTLASCKNSDWGYKINDFAHNEAYGIVDKLSKEDLQYKWYNYFFSMTSYGLAEINKSNQQLSSLPLIDLESIESDTVKLMSTAYQLDQQIEYLYTINESIFNSDQALQNSVNACDDQNLFDIYTSNRSYLYSSLQMAMPQFVSTYSISFTAPTDNGTSGSQNKDNGGGIDSIPLIGNIVTFLSDKKAKKNKEKFEEAQTYINNLRLDQTELRQTSKIACENNKAAFEETLQLLKADIELQKAIFQKTYSSLARLRDSLAPLVIKNIINNFSSNDKFIYDVLSDTRFTNRIMEMYQVAKNLNPEIELNSVEALESTENKLKIVKNLISELEIEKNTVFGIKNVKLINSLTSLLNGKKEKLINSTNGRLK